MLSVVVAGAREYPAHAGRVAGAVAATAIVFWLAHVYAHALGHSVAHEQRVSLAELREIAQREASLVEASLLPVAALCLGAVGVVSSGLALWLAFAAGLAVLAEQGVVFARAEGLGRLGTVAVVAGNLALGLVLVALKLLLDH